MVKRIGMLTGGGDCPGVNAVIRAIVRKAIVHHGIECVGVMRGWRGLLDGLIMPLDLDAVSGILPRGGTILRTSRTNPFAVPNGAAIIAENMRKFAIDAVVVIGGGDTLAVAHRLHVENGLPVIGVPKTIDNDVLETEYSFGFDSTVNVAMEAIDRIHTTAESHDRVMVVEVMGRHAGWIAMYAGLAAGADLILVPERPVGLQEICDVILKRHERGKDFSIVVVAEGARVPEINKGEAITQDASVDEFGHVRLGGAGTVIAKEIEKRTGFETRVTVLGHIQRGGTPTAFDRVLGTRFGVAAVEMIVKGEFGKMVAIQANRIVSVPLADAVKNLRLVPPEFTDVAKVFEG